MGAEMTAGAALSPNCLPEHVERAVLEAVIDLLPIRLTVTELCLRIAADPEDRREVEVVRHAIRDLKRSGLLRYRNDDQIVEPTQAAVQAFALLTL
jgi:hypothetical protein